MKVNVVVWATLRRYWPDVKLGEARVVEVEPGVTMAELRDRLGLPAEEVKVVMCNHLQADFTEEVHDGDRVAFIPAVAGG
jgi:molybdopterin converting factor small subunit